MLWKFFNCRSCSYFNWKVPFCPSVSYYLSVPLARCYICVLLKTHTYTHTPPTPSVCCAPLQDFTCSEGCFPSSLDTNCLQWFFIICLHHWALYIFFSTHTHSFAARVLHSALIHRVWNCLQKSFLLWNFRVKLHATIVAHKMNASHVLCGFSLSISKHTRLDSKSGLAVFPMSLHHQWSFLITYYFSSFHSIYLTHLDLYDFFIFKKSWLFIILNNIVSLLAV